MPEPWVFPRHRGGYDDYGAHQAGAPYRIVFHTPEIPDGPLRTFTSVADQIQNGKSRAVYDVLVSPYWREVAQFCPLDRAAGSLKRVSATETNRAGTIAVSLCGYARDMHNLTGAQLDWIGRDVIAPIIAAGYPVDLGQLETFYGADAGFTLASPSAPQRMSDAEWLAFDGVCGHQHVPGNDHWDPGRLNVARIVTAASNQGDPFMALTDEEQAELLELVRRTNGTIHGTHRSDIRPRLTAVDERVTGVGGDEELADEIVRRVVEAMPDGGPGGGVDYGALAEALRPVIREELDSTRLGPS